MASTNLITLLRRIKSTMSFVGKKAEEQLVGKGIYFLPETPFSWLSTVRQMFNEGKFFLFSEGKMERKKILRPDDQGRPKWEKIPRETKLRWVAGQSGRLPRRDAVEKNEKKLLFSLVEFSSSVINQPRCEGAKGFPINSFSRGEKRCPKRRIKGWRQSTKQTLRNSQRRRIIFYSW